MGFMDSISSTFNRGTAAAERTARSAKLKSQINGINRERQALAAQLGASLYLDTKDDAKWHEGRETLYDGIADCDTRRDACQAEIAQIEEEARAAQVAATSYTCPGCGATVAATDMFCSGCGMPIDQIKAAYPATPEAAPAGPTCPTCGALISEDDVFCTACGASLKPAAPVVVPEVIEDSDKPEDAEKSEKSKKTE